MEERLNYIKKEFRNRFESVIINQKEYYKVNDELYIDIVGIPSFNCLIIGYAESFDDAKKYFFEDGDRFGMELSAEEMLNRMLEEIAA